MNNDRRAIELLLQVEENASSLWTLLQHEPDEVIRSLSVLSQELGFEPLARRLEMYLDLRALLRAT